MLVLRLSPGSAPEAYSGTGNPHFGGDSCRFVSVVWFHGYVLQNGIVFTSEKGFVM